MEHVTCEKCQGILPKDEALVRTIMIAPPMYGYSHPDCRDPWADYTPGIRTAKEVKQLERDFGATKGEDPVNSPAHYRWLPNGIEVIDITETLNFTMGNAVKYILRADHKGKPIEDLRKAAWYIEREIARRESGE
jgi:hypothetical protein